MPAYPVSKNCPRCGSASCKTVKPETPHFTGQWDRVCQSCGTRYTPPIPAWAGVVISLLGVGLIALAVIMLTSLSRQPGPVSGGTLVMRYLGTGALALSGLGLVAGGCYLAFRRQPTARRPGSADHTVVPPGSLAPVEPQPSFSLRPGPTIPGESHWRKLAVPVGDPAARRVLGYMLQALVVLLVLGIVVGYSLLNQPNVTALVRGLGFGGLALLGSFALGLQVFARRLRAAGALEVLSRDSRPPVLLLRAFDEDLLPVVNTEPRQVWWAMNATHRTTFEEVVHAALWAAGPVVAIGRPGEGVPPLGAARFWISEDRWQSAVEELLQEAQLVVLVMGDLSGRAGLVWEAGQLFGLPWPQKAVLVMPPVGEREAQRRWEQYLNLSGGKLPPWEGGEVAVTFDASGRCQVFRVKAEITTEPSRDELAYRTALRLASSDSPPA